MQDSYSVSQEIIILPHSQCSLHQCEGRWRAVGSGSLCSCLPSLHNAPSRAFISGACCSGTHSPARMSNLGWEGSHTRCCPDWGALAFGGLGSAEGRKSLSWLSAAWALLQPLGCVSTVLWPAILAGTSCGNIPWKTFSSSFSVLMGFPRLCTCSPVSVRGHPDLRII